MAVATALVAPGGLRSIGQLYSPTPSASPSCDRWRWHLPTQPSATETAQPSSQRTLGVIGALTLTAAGCASRSVSGVPQSPLVSHSDSAQDSCRCVVARVASRCDPMESESVKRELHKLPADCGGNASSPMPVWTA